MKILIISYAYLLLFLFILLPYNKLDNLMLYTIQKDEILQYMQDIHASTI